MRLKSTYPNTVFRRRIAVKQKQALQYAYALNNPVRYTDPTGKWIVGTDGNSVIYSIKSGWSRNVSDVVRKVRNAMLGTVTGAKQLNYMLHHTEKISMAFSSEIILEGENKYRMGNDHKTVYTNHSDGSIVDVEHEITIYDKAIEREISNEAGDNPYKGLTMDEAIGAVAGHESGHTERENTNIDVKGGTLKEIEAHPDEIENQILKEIHEKQLFNKIEILKIPELKPVTIPEERVFR